MIIYAINCTRFLIRVEKIEIKVPIFNLKSLNKFQKCCAMRRISHSYLKKVEISLRDTQNNHKRTRRASSGTFERIINLLHLQSSSEDRSRFLRKLLLKKERRVHCGSHSFTLFSTRVRFFTPVSLYELIIHTQSL